MFAGGIAGFYAQAGVMGNVAIQDLTPRILQSASASPEKTVVLDNCQYLETLETGGIPNSLSPLLSLKLYLRKTNVVTPQYITDAVVTVTKQPSFGKLVGAVSKYGEMDFTYVANDKNWLGKDRAEFEVSYQGKTYKIIERIVIVGNVDLYHTPEDERACSAKVRRIAYETSVQTADSKSGEYEFDWDGVNAMLDSAATRLDLPNIMLVFLDLPNGAVREWGQVLYCNIVSSRFRIPGGSGCKQSDSDCALLAWGGIVAMQDLIRRAPLDPMPPT